MAKDHDGSLPGTDRREGKPGLTTTAPRYEGNLNRKGACTDCTATMMAGSARRLWPSQAMPGLVWVTGSMWP